MDLWPGRVIADRYQLEGELARGGMGSVWSATHRQLDTSVAVKFMDRELAGSPDARARFEREAKAAASLRSPHVVQVLDYGVDEGTPFIVMELLHGEDLRRRLKRLRRLPLLEAADVVRQACKALQLAADAGIVHRDLKPANVFLARSGDDEIVKVLDFGVAKAATPHAVGPGTSSGVLLGSPHYMSPEQARGGRALDHRSDLWSLAVILYQMLTGHKPFTGTELGDVIVKICTESLPPVTAADPSLPASIDTFFDRALCREPAGRFATAREFSRELDRLVGAHLGLALGSASGRLAAFGSSDSLEGLTPHSLRELPEPAPLRTARDSRSETPAAGARTLTAALDRPASSRGWRLGIAAALIATGAAAAFVLAVRSEGRPESDPGASQASAPPIEPAASSPPPAPSPEPAPTVEASAKPEPSSSASAAPSAAARPLRPRPRPRPAPAPAPAADPAPRDPVLGF